MAGWHLFEVTGIELEYMIVDRRSLAVRPIADRLLAAVNGGVIASEVARGLVSWSNELVSHVIEIKTTSPVAAIDGKVLEALQRDLAEMNRLLAEHGARLLPTAMHPLMEPLHETVLWPHDYSPVYQAYDRIFGCQGHGWSNLQSLHLNYPFQGDDEFGRLHAAIRLILPILPALAASSPMVEGHWTPSLDNRLEYYRTNSRAIPSVAGDIVPEPVFDRASYQEQIFDRVYRDVAPHDPEGVLRDEFLNSRGAIARFERGSIEIRLLDVQECPRADLAIAAAVTAVLQLLVEERLSAGADQRAWPTAPLATVLRGTMRQAAAFEITDAAYLRTLGLDAGSASAGELWRHLVDRAADAGLVQEPWGSTLEELLQLDTLAVRLRRLLGEAPSRDDILAVYGRLASCLTSDQLLRP